MPVYNGATYLEAAIESIRRQTHRDFEFIIVDDGSTDGSGELLQRIAVQDSRFRVVHGTHEGGAAARNRGLALARARSSSAWMPDDIWVPERIERQLAYLVQFPEVAAVGSALRLVNRDGDPIAPPTKYPLTFEEIRNGLHWGYCSLGQPTVAMRRRRVPASHFDSAEDYDLWVRLSERYPLGNMPDVLGRLSMARRQHDGPLPAQAGTRSPHCEACRGGASQWAA
jgi:glycosyltransferase involved in cell wall biosynthesis